MSELENTIRTTLEFILKTNISKRNPGFEKIDRQVSMPREYIIDAVKSAEPYYIADEVLLFYLATNDLLVDYGGYLLSNNEPLNGNIFRLFPFELVMALSPLVRMMSWKDIEPYPNLFVGDGYFLNTCRLEAPQAHAPISCCLKFEEDEILSYSNLTNLLLMVAECYETNAYYYDQSESWMADWREDFSKSEVIFHKYNPGLKFRSPNKLEHFELNY
jgi:hypothetical protein